MITRQKLLSALDGDTKNPFQNKNIDHHVIAITLLRERIPYEVCKSIIATAQHGQIWLCDVDDCLPYLTDADLSVLADCNISIDGFDSLYLFI